MRRTVTIARRATAVLAAAAGVLAIAACGANSDAGAAGTEASTTAAAEQSAATTATPTTESNDTASTAGTDDSMTDDSTTDHSMADDSMADDSMADHSMADGTDHSDMDSAEMAASAWPRPWDPSEPIDFSGVPGVTAEQQAFAEDLAARTIADLPQFSDPESLEPLGYFSIGDEGTGHEHYINAAYLVDDHQLDPNYPESVVFEVDGDKRTLVSAMFMVSDKKVDDPELEAIGGPLMQWHIHNDLCWRNTPEGPQVAGVHAAGAPCPEGQFESFVELPMVHVWIAPHQCGPFAALEGIGAGQVDPNAKVRMDQCHQEH